MPAEARGQRLDRWLAARPEADTRSQLAQAIAHGRVRVDGATAKASLKLRGGERIELAPAPAVAPTDIVPEPIDLEILYADDRLIAVNKPAGMVVHPAAGNRAGTLVNALLHRYGAQRLPGAPERAGIVHRLDRETSGVILVALDARAHEALARQFRLRTLRKRYLALVRGDVRGAGTIDAPIGRHPHDRKRMSVAARQARDASTTYRPLERFGAATWLEVEPKTGRTHQIRVHLASRGWPVAGDSVYGVPSARALATARRKAAAAEAVLAGLTRHALHASRIELAHPHDGRPLVIEAPVPADLNEVLASLRSVAAGRR